MKASNFFLLLLLLFDIGLVAAQDIEPAPNDKAVVYFLRPEGFWGGAVKFTYFDGNKVVGKFAGRNYIRYECEPGTHNFWAKSENRSYVQGNLEPGKIYLIEAQPTAGILYARVRLKPVDPSSKDMWRFQKLITNKGGKKFTDTLLANMNNRFTGKAMRGLIKLKKLEVKGKEIPKIDGEMAMDAADLYFTKADM
ncbi:MAG: hypothetical protein AAF206_15495 [Bacteroidota bacterium]